MSSASLQHLADEELMPLVDQRRGGAFEVLYDRHAKAVFSLAYRVVGDRALAEEVSQESFLAIWRRASLFDGSRGSVRGWMLGVVRHRAIDALRRKGAAPVGVEFPEEDTTAALPSSERTDEEVIRRDTAREVKEALDAVSSEQAQVIQLAYYAGFTHSEIAGMLDVPLGTVKGRMRLGLERMRGRIAEGVA